MVGQAGVEICDVFLVVDEKRELWGGKGGGLERGERGEAEKVRVKEGDAGSAECFPSSCNCLQMLEEGEGTHWWRFDSEGGLHI